MGSHPIRLVSLLKESRTDTWVQGRSRWLNGKESACQCRRYKFDCWDGKVLWRRKWLPTPVFFPGKSLGQRSLVGYSPWGGKESDTTEQLNTHTHTDAQRKDNMITQQDGYLQAKVRGLRRN